MALMRPDLVTLQDIALVQGTTAEDQLLIELFDACLVSPNSKPSALLHTIKSADATTLMEVARELHLLPENVDFALEFVGLRTQLSEGMQQLKETQLLNQIKEKPISALTTEERELLRKLGIK